MNYKRDLFRQKPKTQWYNNPEKVKAVAIAIGIIIVLILMGALALSQPQRLTGF